MNNNMTDNLFAAIKRSDIQEVAALIAAGADVHYQDTNGYDALINAAYGEDDSKLLEMLTLLIQSGAPVIGMSSYCESAVRVLSRMGYFEAVRLLLDAGANPEDIQLNPLMEAVAFGSLTDMKEAISQGVDMEASDYWERTAWLFAVQTGDVSKAEFLLSCGADSKAKGRCGKLPLFYAIETQHMPMLEWLLRIGADVNETDDFGHTALIEAAWCDNVRAVEILLRAGVDVNYKADTGPALNYASNRAVILRLLEAGADPIGLSSERQRAILGYPSEPGEKMLTVSADEFERFRSPSFGTTNPEMMNNPFWEGMIRSGLNAYQAGVKIEGQPNYEADIGPIWCADRFGQSLTFLEDGRIVQIAGEHEDSYDADFCIYNDVVVHAPDGRIIIYGYPEAVFPPTDSHTATLIGGHIYLIGSIGYQGTRQFGETPVYRLNTDTFQIDRLQTSGHNPGWIYKHRAVLTAPHEIQITGGKVASNVNGVEHHSDNADTFTLNTDTLTWASMLPG
jgi:ankyrin repeat protein